MTRARRTSNLLQNSDTAISRDSREGSLLKWIGDQGKACWFSD
ncbi:hypothetical protein LINGRAHAP2_LOCUS9371 [Linum grandiflorum]